MLRTNLRLGLLSLVALLLGMGLYSVDRCSALGHRIEAISRDVDETGRSISQLRRTCAAMTGALLSRVTGDRTGSMADFAAAQKDFQNAVQEEQPRVRNQPDEKALLAKIAAADDAYQGQAKAFLELPGNVDAGGQATAAKLGRQTAQLLDLIDQLAVAHQTALRDGHDVGSDINETIRGLLLFGITAVLIALYASSRVSRGLLNPLSTLAASIREVGEGNLDQTVPVLSRDELGQLADSFNKMAAQLKEYRASTSVELTRLNLTIRTTLASFPDPIFVLNQAGAVEFRNPEADKLALKLLFSGVQRLPQVVDEKVEHVRRTGEDYLPTLFKDAIKFHIDGQDQYFLPRIVLLREEKEEAFGVAVILENVTRMLLLDDVKSNLISTVSHELKTPLTSVRMALYLLVEKTVGPLNDKQLDLVGTAREDADRLLRTLNDLLDLAKLEQGPAQLALEEAAPAELIEAAAHAGREMAQSAGIALKTEVAPDLPPVRIDRQRLAYVFSNFVTNAIKYSPGSSRVLLLAGPGVNRAGRPAVRFAVKDQGPGISPEHQAHVFERFYRVPGTNKTGAGLGLSIAREVVMAHGGEIGVVSVPGQGSEFFFVLPPARDELPS
jgi:signal transduction histidine kinase/HAMP domain-containing protein